MSYQTSIFEMVALVIVVYAEVRWPLMYSSFVRASDSIGDEGGLHRVVRLVSWQGPGTVLLVCFGLGQPWAGFAGGGSGSSRAGLGTFGVGL